MDDGEKKPMQRLMILKNTLMIPGETLKEFADQLKRLTPEETDELAQLGAEYLGVEIA